jgi:hypothetical protein
LVKTITSIFIFLLCCVLSLQAQSTFRLGLHGGGIYSQVGDGIKFSVTGETPLNDYISLRPEVSFIKKAFDHGLASIDPEKEYILTFQHGLEVAIPVKFRFDFNKWNFFGAIGPYGTKAFELKGNLVKETGGGEYRKERIEFEDSRLNPFDFGISIGGGVEKTIANNNRIVVQAFKNWGLMDADLQSATVAFSENVAIMLGITFPLGQIKE